MSYYLRLNCCPAKAVYQTRRGCIITGVNHMNAYIEELIEKLNATEFCRGTESRAEDYSAGLSMLVEKFTEHKRARSQVFFFGNGGSAAIASHMTADFMKNGGMRTYSLYDSAVTTCMGNDYGYEYVFSKPLEFLANPGDLLVAISSSGNSGNILRAINAAKGKGVFVVTLTGFKPDNQARSLGDMSVYVPVEKYGIVESIHNLILQQVVDTIMERDGVTL